jgi:hypothetical protein
LVRILEADKQLLQLKLKEASQREKQLQVSIRVK